MADTIYTQEPGQYHVQKTVGGWVVVYIEDEHTMRSVDGGKVHASRQNAYAKAARLNAAMQKSIQEAQEALEQGKVVLAEFGSRRVTVNVIAQDSDGRWFVKWSHRDFPQSQDDYVDESQKFTVHPEYGRRYW